MEDYIFRSLTDMSPRDLYLRHNAALVALQKAWREVSKPRGDSSMSLLDELEDSFGSSTAGSFGSGGGGQSHTRIPINVAAMDLAARWVGEMTINNDALTVKRNTESDIRSVLGRMMRLNLNHEAPEILEGAAKDLNEFRRQVEAVLSPPRRVELRVECPECELPAAEYPFTVTLGTGLLVARCKGCAASWVGEKQLRLLAGDVLDDKNFDSTGVLD